MSAFIYPTISKFSETLVIYSSLCSKSLLSSFLHSNTVLDVRLSDSINQIDTPIASDSIARIAVGLYVKILTLPGSLLPTSHFAFTSVIAFTSVYMSVLWSGRG